MTKSNFFVLAVLFIIVTFAFYIVGGIFPAKLNTTGAQGGAYVLVTPKPGNPKQGLQLELVKLKGCSSTTTVDFLIDRSGSMAYGKKLSSLQTGVLSFVNKLSDQSIFGLQSFSQQGTAKGEWSNDINPDLFSSVKGKITDVICSIHPDGGTYTKNAFEKTKTVLADTKNRFPDRKLVLIFISDGVPETIESDRACIPEDCRANSCACFAPEQDPTSVANEIKTDLGVKIYSIAYLDVKDEKLTGKLEAMMKRVASSESNYYRAPNETDIIQILNLIGNEICSE
ncbi:MAG: hypothetical protein A2152_04045 [Candidatus Levybacteria bacterium RBG_16_35_6]|nr:MAG: hypothetical protein A2152_04045 [Candidatus Levybacteria bacterium RBG_16_35_6]